MIERRGDLWELAEETSADAVVITTNGDVRRDGTAVMGAGCAKEAARRWPHLRGALGGLIRHNGNVVHHLGSPDGLMSFELASFPVKHHWREMADPPLVERSARQLAEMADVWRWERVLLPRPGCGNGGLEWNAVRPLIADVLDDRFVAVTW